MLIDILALVFVLAFLIIIHEAGHFVVARLLGAPVDVFSIGFGRRLWGFERGGTDYRISLVPLGGYVRIVGLGPDESDLARSDAGGPEPVLLPRWKRTLILLAGPVTNIVAAVLLVAVVFTAGMHAFSYEDEAPVVARVEAGSPAAAAGVEPGDRIVTVNGVLMPTWREVEMALGPAGGQRVTLELKRGGATKTVAMTLKETRFGVGYSGILPPLGPVVQTVQRHSPAEQAGLAVGDRILAVNGKPVFDPADLVQAVSPHPDEDITLAVDRSGQTLDLTVKPRDAGGEGQIGVGIAPATHLVKVGPLRAVPMAVAECWRQTVETFHILGKLLTRKTSMRQIAGPIGIAQISGEAARTGVSMMIWILGVISLQLGIFNLLPIPILDGGHLTVIAIETIIRRDFSIKVKERILEVGFVLLILLMVVVLYNDILKVVPESLYKILPGGG